MVNKCPRVNVAVRNWLGWQSDTIKFSGDDLMGKFSFFPRNFNNPKELIDHYVIPGNLAKLLCPTFTARDCPKYVPGEGSPPSYWHRFVSDHAPITMSIGSTKVKGSAGRKSMDFNPNRDPHITKGFFEVWEAAKPCESWEDWLLLAEELWEVYRGTKKKELLTKHPDNSIKSKVRASIARRVKARTDLFSELPNRWLSAKAAVVAGFLLPCI